MEEKVFHPFLNSDEKNILQLNENPIKCDCDMLWLFKERVRFINRTNGFKCNDKKSFWEKSEKDFDKCKH